MRDPIYVTKPFLPPIEDFVREVGKIWDTNVLTNGGPLHSELEERLADYLGVPYVVLFTNGTIALQTAIQSLRLSGQVITTPYSFVATAHSILWNGLEPIFVDIDQHDCNIDPSKIERSITKDTSAIVAVHTYGFPCRVRDIQAIADAYNLRVIYDAAHAFAVAQDDSSILLHGDLSVLSLHATKVFNTFEGGAVICKDASVRNRLNYLKNFGFVDELKIAAVGTNGKMSEVSAAMGLVQLNYVEANILSRKQVFDEYMMGLVGVRGIRLMKPPCNAVHNYSYFPIIIDSPNVSRDDVYEMLKAYNVFARRYFYPLLSDLPIYSGRNHDIELPNAKYISEHVLCLPIYAGLDLESVRYVIDCLKTILSDGSNCKLIS